jgi:fatty acid desaturase
MPTHLTSESELMRDPRQERDPSSDCAGTGRAGAGRAVTGQTDASADMAEMRRIIADLFVHRPAVYWTDFLVSTTVGYAAALTFVFRDVSITCRIACFLIAGFALFRTATFIHEIVHMRKGLMPGFRLAWNVLFGVPMLTPSLLYSNHLDHHRRRHYGTSADGEYQPFARRSVLSFANYFGQVLVLPFFALARFLVVGPLSYLHPGLRRWTLERFSSYVSNFRYRRVLAPNEPYLLWLLTDIACFACALGLVGPLVLGLKPWTLLARFYLLAVFTIGLNWVRNLAGHRFRNEGEPMSVLGQLLDSVTVTGSPLWTELMFPLGLRYHALHHLFPSLPYHALGTAHRRLTSQLQPGSPYHQTIQPTLLSALRQLWSEAQAAGGLAQQDNTRGYPDPQRQ